MKASVCVEIIDYRVQVARLVPITKSPYEEYIESSLIIPVNNSGWQRQKPNKKLKK